MQNNRLSSTQCGIDPVLIASTAPDRDPEHTGRMLAEVEEYAVSMCMGREDRRTFWQPRQRDGQSLLPSHIATPPLPLPAPPAATALQTPWQLGGPDLARGADNGGGGRGGGSGWVWGGGFREGTIVWPASCWLHWVEHAQEQQWEEARCY